MPGLNLECDMSKEKSSEASGKEKHNTTKL